MGRIIRIIILSALLAALLSVGGCRGRRGGQAPAPSGSCTQFYYEVAVDSSKTDWLEAVPVFHCWVDIEPGHHLFGDPSGEQVERWKALCEERNPADSVLRNELQGAYLNMNQYMTVHDFIELWYHEDSYSTDDSLTLWRLMQYDAYFSQNIYSDDSEYDRFSQLQDIIGSLCLFEAGTQWEMNFKAGLECDFQEFYDRMLLKETARHAGAEVAHALLLEDESWKRYHAALDSAFRVIDGDPNGFSGSAWPMAISGIARDDAENRAVSLEDYYFALTDSLDYGPAGNHRMSRIGEYVIEKHAPVGEDAVIGEYARFIGFLSDKDFYDPGFSFPLDVRRKALSEERDAWKEWMSSRKRVSSLLSGLCKETYDNSTNNVRRRKLIMLKNRYQGFGLTSGDIMECILPYSCDDSAIGGFSFERNWKEL